MECCAPQDGGTTDASALGGHSIALYFGASWCAPCSEFGPSLVRAHAKLLEKATKFAVVYISSDQTEQVPDPKIWLGHSGWASGRASGRVYGRAGIWLGIWLGRIVGIRGLFLEDAEGVDSIAVEQGRA